MIDTLIKTLEYIAQIALFAPVLLFLCLLIEFIFFKGFVSDKRRVDTDYVLLLVVLIITMFVEYIGLNMWLELAS